MNQKKSSFICLLLVFALSNFLVNENNAYEHNSNKLFINNKLLNIPNFGPIYNEFHEFLPDFMTLNWSENSKHYENLVDNFTKQFPSRGWEGWDPRVQMINNSLAVEWYKNKLLNYTINKIEPLSGQGSLIFGELKSVIGILPADSATSQTMIIGGHLDSVNNTSGADDNASGSLAVLEIARLLSEANWSIGFNIIFCGFNGEEDGFLGSSELVTYLNSISTYDIQLMINFDMLLNDKKESNYKIDVIFDGDQGFERSAYWSGLFKALSYNYGSNVFNMIKSHDDWRWVHSDHYSFASQDYPSVFLIESNLTNKYHSPDDRWNNEEYNYNQAYEVIISTLGLIRYADEIQGSYHGLNIQIDSINHRKFQFIPENDSIIALRSWDFNQIDESIFVIKNSEGETKGISSSISDNLSLSYWSGPLEDDLYTVEINEEVASAKLDFIMGKDSNNNNLPDIWENAFDSIGSGDSDYDNDGLTNFEEFSYNLNPEVSDMDGDGFNDGTEIKRGANPLDSVNVPTISTDGFNYVIIFTLVTLISLNKYLKRKKI